VKTLETVLRRIERWSSAIAMGVMVTIMVVVVADVFLRYAFHRPLAWTYDFISLYLMAGLFYFALSVSYESKSLVSIDMLYERFSERGKTWSRLATNLSAIVLFVLIGYSSGIRAYDEFTFGDVSGGVIPWPSWISAAIVTAGAVLLALRMALEILQAALQLGGQPARTDAGHAGAARHIPIRQPTGSDVS
jgi:TRAP-type C4-dicarboxylate transport system permease small subunit